MSITARSRLPILVADAPGWDGAVLRFGPYLTDMPGRAAEFVDKILRGANPAELPVEQPRKYGLVVDLKLARALGLTIAPAALIRPTVRELRLPRVSPGRGRLWPVTTPRRSRS